MFFAHNNKTFAAGIHIAALGCLFAAGPSYSDVKPAPHPPKITSIAVDSNNIIDGEKLNITIAGEVKSCNYYLTITNTDTQLEWSFPKTSAFPAPDKINFDLADKQYTYGNFKLTAKAKANDVRPGTPCGGGGNYVTFKKSRRTIQLAADTPQIVDVNLQPGKKMGGTNRYRTDESLNFAVVGNVENKEAKDAAKRCGWTAWLTDNNGAKTTLGKGNQFGVTTNGALTGLVTGGYTLTVHTTAADDAPGISSCLGKATKSVDVFATPGVIKGLGVEAIGRSPWPYEPEYGLVTMTPKIDGPACVYKVTRIMNHGKATRVTFHTHKDGAADAIPTEQYSDDETFLELIVEGMGVGGCEGVAKKTLTVYDEPNKKGVFH